MHNLTPRHSRNISTSTSPPIWRITVGAYLAGNLLRVRDEEHAAASPTISWPWSGRLYRQDEGPVSRKSRSWDRGRRRRGRVPLAAGLPPVSRSWPRRHLGADRDSIQGLLKGEGNFLLESPGRGHDRSPYRPGTRSSSGLRRRRRAARSPAAMIGDQATVKTLRKEREEAPA